IQASPFECFSVAAGSGCGGNPNDFRAHVNVFGSSFLMNFAPNQQNALSTGKNSPKKGSEAFEKR
ncbi:MAG: hypothetical protein ABF379_13555, partial [Akkermansiaceae bacterium]